MRGFRFLLFNKNVGYHINYFILENYIYFMEMINVMILCLINKKYY